MGKLLLKFGPGDLSQEDENEIRALAPDLPVVVSNDQDEIETYLDEIEAAAGHGPYGYLLRGKNLRWLQQWGAGTDWLLKIPQQRKQDFVLTNASGVHPIPISEHILAMLLAFARRLPFAFRAQSRRQWRAPEGDNTFELAGQTVLIVGVGAIGERTAELCRALGMRVLGVRRSPENGVSGVEHMFAPADLLEALPEADFVVLTVPLTEETRGLIGPEELRTMQPSAYLINIGRGGTVQTDALVQALQAGQIAGAGLDVTDPEPLPEDSPLWDMPNVIITAHYSGSTPKYDERAMQIFKDNLRRYLAGEELQNQVDIELGY